MNKIYIAILLVVSFLANANAQLTQRDQRDFVSSLLRITDASATTDQLETGQLNRDTITKIVLLLANTNETEIHRMSGQHENKTYLHKDGKKEAVYDKSGKLVKDGINDGSYNYFHPQNDPLRHFTFDITPWIQFGTSRKDPTSMEKRIHAYSADIFAAVSRIRKKRLTAGDKDVNDLKQIGQVEAVSIILNSIEKGDAQDLLKALDANNEFSDDKLIETVKAFERGMLKVFASTNAAKPKEADSGS